MSIDPTAPAAGDPFNFNRFAYANNNPIGNIDPDGRDILVIAGGRRTGSLNVLSHVASSIEGYGMASYGNSTRLGSSTSEYIASQSAFRDQVVTVITTTPAQDAKAVNFIQANQNENSASLIDNCAVKTNLVVNASGVNTNGIPFPGGTSRDVSSLPGTRTYFIPRNGEIPQELQDILTRFDPPPRPPPPPPPPPPEPPEPRQAQPVS